jgi:hypothetical protein
MRGVQVRTKSVASDIARALTSVFTEAWSRCGLMADDETRPQAHGRSGGPGVPACESSTRSIVKDACSGQASIRGPAA